MDFDLIEKLNYNEFNEIYMDFSNDNLLAVGCSCGNRGYVGFDVAFGCNCKGAYCSFTLSNCASGCQNRFGATFNVSNCLCNFSTNAATCFNGNN